MRSLLKKIILAMVIVVFLGLLFGDQNRISYLFNQFIDFIHRN